MRRIPITDLHTPELEIYNERREIQLLRYYEPAPGLFIAESANVILRALTAGYEPLSLLMEQREADSEKGREVLGRIMERSEEIPVYVSSNEVLSQISGFKLARGMLCAMRRRALPKMEELCRDARRIAILENVVNPTNVGAIFRCAAALGIDAVLLTAGCSDPLYRRAARVSMGTVFQVPWTFLGTEDWADRTMAQLRGMGYRTAAMIMAITAGFMSFFSSGLGVVFPTLIPTASGLASGLGVGAVELVTVIVIGGTVSGFTPISTTGALIMAGVAQQENAEEKFPQNRLFVELFAVSFIALAVLAIMAVIGVYGWIG